MSQPHPGPAFYEASRACACARSSREPSQARSQASGPQGGRGPPAWLPQVKGQEVFGVSWMSSAPQEPFQRGQELDLGFLVASRMGVLTEGHQHRLSCSRTFQRLTQGGSEHRNCPLDTSVSHQGQGAVPTPGAHSQAGAGEEDRGSPGSPFPPKSPRPDTFPVSN